MQTLREKSYYDRADQQKVMQISEKEIQSNLGDSNADFSKPQDFSNLAVSPDLFCYHLM